MKTLPAVYENWAVGSQHVVVNSPSAIQYKSCVCTLVIEANHLKVLNNALVRGPFLK